MAKRPGSGRNFNKSLSTAARARVAGRRPFAMASSFIGSSQRSLAYDATGNGRRSPGMISSAGPNSALLGALDRLRNLSRDAVRQNGYAKRIVNNLTANIVGTGIRPLTPFRKLQKLWDLWCDEADSRGQLDFYGMQALAVTSTIEAGEMFGRFRSRRPGDMDTIPLQIQLLEADHVPTNKTLTGANGNAIVGGIERDATDEAAAYWMYRQHPQDRLTIKGGDLIEVRVPAADVFHMMYPRRIGQQRGEPWLAQALVKLRDLDLYDDAELVRKKSAALYGGFIKTAGAEDDGQVVAGITGNEEAAETVVDPLEPGTFPVLPPGYDVEFSEPADVGGAYEAFMRQQLSAIAVSVDMTYEALSNDWRNVNDRTYRASTLEFSRMLEAWQWHMVVFTMCRPTWRRFVTEAVLSGAWTPPEGVELADVFRVEWTPPARGYINPLQEVAAYTSAVQAGFMTRDQVANLLGTNVAEIDRRMAQEIARMKKWGLNYSAYTQTPGGLVVPTAAAKTALEQAMEAELNVEVKELLEEQGD